MDIKIIPPGGDLAEPMRIREEVFTIEQGFAAPDSDSYDPTATHVMVYLDGVPAATGRFYADGDTFHPGRVAVRKAFRGTGLGRVVMEALEQEARRQGAKKLRLGAQLYARPFMSGAATTPPANGIWMNSASMNIWKRSCQPANKVYKKASRWEAFSIFSKNPIRPLR